MRPTRRRSIRTTILGVLAMAALIWVAVDQFDIPVEEIGQLFLMTVIGVLIIIATAAVAMLMWMAIKRLLDSGKD